MPAPHRQASAAPRTAADAADPSAAPPASLSNGTALTADAIATAPAANPLPIRGEAFGNGASSLRREILVQLRRDGASSPEQLAASLGASRTGVLQQLRSLEAAGLVDRRTVRHGVGRPRHLYDVTAAAQSMFPTNYEGLATGLLSAIEAVGGEELVADVFDARRQLIASQVRRRLADRLPADAPLQARARELAVIQDEQGYLSSAVVEPDGTLRIRQCNCAIYGIASVSTSPCEAEIALYREVLDAEVVRESHIASGDRSCTYRITERREA
jgi:predicted ArsR family transcriptional regulator